MTATRSLRQLFIALIMFVLVLGWALVQMNTRFVNDQGWSSDWLNPQTWLMPMSNHAPLGQAGVNLRGLNDVYFIDVKHGWSVGEYGGIFATNNGGRSWEKKSSRNEINLNSVHFSDNTHGWIVGERGTILVTNNGGDSWQQQTSKVDKNLHSVFFINAQNGWAVGDDGVIIATKNGGESWGKQNSGVATMLTSVQFINGQQGWAAGGEGEGLILTTFDGGQSWNKQSIGSTGFFSVQFINARGWAIDVLGKINITKDGGQSWKQFITKGDKRFNSAHFTDEQHGWLVGSFGDILFSNDGGQSWQEQTSNVKTALNSVFFINAHNGWAVGDNGIIITTNDGGLNWYLQTSSIQTPSFNSIQFTDTKHGWVVGETAINNERKGIVVNTNNGGLNWQIQTIGENYSFNSVKFVDEQYGWIVGDIGYSYGNVLITKDGGQNWWERIAEARVYDTQLYSVWFIDKTHGWAVGLGGGGIFATENSGENWKQQTRVGSEQLNSVYFMNLNYGWVVGDNGVILATDNGGEIWQQQTSGKAERLKSVWFADRLHGWAVGEKGLILTTDNGGTIWREQPSKIETQLNSVQFINNQQGCVVGQNGVILLTNNGGESWQHQTNDVKESLNSVQFSDLQHGWATGENGLILTTTDGGATWKDTSPDLKIFGENRAKLAVFPSPLVIFLLILSSSLVFWRVYQHWAEPRSLQGGISDAPIDSAANDRLGRLELVKTLADLIRNRDTVPPLAIAITAPWGSGKSSMLGLLREQLKGEVFAVQLNVWHYREDGQLLAALMEHIREQALPPLLSLDNLLFRARLLQQRWFSGVGLRTFTVLLVAVIAAVYFARQQEWQLLSDWLSKGQKSLELPAWLQASVDLPWFNTVSVLLAGLVGFRALKAGYASLSAFSPELVAFATQLGKSSREAVQVADWAKDAGLRFRFAKDFEEVANALGKGRLLLLIDDLDRCEPKQIEAVMSTLNFLFSSSAPCYAVLAMDWGYVTDALGLAFKDIAAARRDTDTKGKAFAEHYVEKIVQISLDLPAVDGSRVALVDNSQPRSTAVVVWWQKLAGRWSFISYTPANRWGRYALKAAWFLPRLLVAVVWRGLEAFAWFCWPLLKGINTKLLAKVSDVVLLMSLALLLGLGGVKLGLVAQQFVTVDEKPQVMTMPVNPKPDPTKPDNKTKELINPPESITPVKVEMVDEELYPTQLWLGFFTTCLAVILLLMVWRLSLRVQDTQVFIEVMNEWRDFLSSHHDTPRDWKRLMNRARLFAMRVRVHQQKPWYENIDKKWQAFRFQCPPSSVVEKPVVLNEHLAMHLMMLDVYRKGELVEKLQKLHNRSDISAHMSELLNSEEIQHFIALNNFFRLVNLYFETEESKQAKAQLTLWLSLYAGLNSTRQNGNPPVNNPNVHV